LRYLEGLERKMRLGDPGLEKGPGPAIMFVYKSQLLAWLKDRSLKEVLDLAAQHGFSDVRLYQTIPTSKDQP
jgi:hypothetical protein